ncbi:MAG: hypothetical protein ACXW3T_16435 [Rhodoplanes sp.]
MFALKGLTGFYKGYFALLPYHEKVTQYSDKAYPSRAIG